MFKSSALLATAALAADSVNNYTGTIPGDATTKAGHPQGSLSDLSVKVQVDQKAAQVTYDYNVSGTFGAAQSDQTDLTAGLCYKVGDTYDCTVFAYTAAWAAGASYTGNDGYTINAYRATGVSAADSKLTVWTAGSDAVIKTTTNGDAHKSATNCAFVDKKASKAKDAAVWTVDTETTGLCATIALNKDKQAVDAAKKSFVMQATVTPTVSASETAAIALLSAFKTASTTMRGGWVYGTANGAPIATNTEIKLTFVEVAGASAMTTFAVAIAAAAALF